MKRTVKASIVAVIALAVVLGMGSTALAKNKSIVISKIKGNTLYYYTGAMVSDRINDAGFENFVGFGKKKSVKLSKNAVFYLIKTFAYPFKVKKVSKKVFVNRVSTFGCKKEKTKGVTWYWAMAAKITLRNGKCVKVRQLFQS